MVIRILFISLFLSSFTFAKPWFHIELGAGNYGADGHTQKSQKRTVGKKLVVTSAHNYIDDLVQENSFCCLPANQYRILFDTLEELIAKHRSDEGIFHINDLFPEYAEYAADAVRRYAKSRGYNRLVIETVPGDYALINPSDSLRDYGRNRYDSAHLKNAEISFFAEAMDGDNLVSSAQSRCEGRQVLQRLASLATEGLELTVVFHPNFIPMEELALMAKHIFYQPSSAKIMPYVWPEGETMPPGVTRVFHIPAKEPLSYVLAQVCAL